MRAREGQAIPALAPKRMTAGFMILLLAVGFVSILAQVVLMRELSVAFYGIELIYILAIGVWLLCTAVGAALGPRRPASRPAGISWPLAVSAMLLPADLLFVRSIHPVFSGVSGAFLPFPTQLLAMTLALLPAGILLGLAFRQAARPIPRPADRSPGPMP